MKSQIKLYGPKISKGQRALLSMVKEIKQDASFTRLVTILDPAMDIMTQKMITEGERVLGEYDFVIEWCQRPSRESFNQLISKLDHTLEPTGCRYTITTAP